MPRRLSRAEESVILSTLGVRTSSLEYKHITILVNLVMLSSCKIKMPRTGNGVSVFSYPQSRVARGDT